MTPEKQSIARIREIFAEAQEIPAGAGRNAFISGACKGSPELEKEVLSLLGAYDTTCDFLTHDASGATFIDTPDLTGSQIDHYRLIELIGEGGFGEVYRAEQTEPFEREVALKIIKLGMDTKGVIARFKAERQALARMNHPNIAQVYDAGSTDTGRPYFVMELVHGVPILEYCDGHHLPLSDRIALFQQVCDGVQHAHKKGILHRDLKPSNILVCHDDGLPLPKIIDFGIAKSLENRLTKKTLATLEEILIGTPMYMSPEQLEQGNADIDARSDIYSLGIILYEMMAGATPIAHRTPTSLTIAEMREALQTQDLPRPSKRFQSLGRRTTVIARRRNIRPHVLERLLKGDLDWIVMKAIEVEPYRRYEDIISLSDDLDHFLNHEPVSAGRPGLAYRGRKFIRRHRAASIVISGITLSLIIGTTISTIGFVHATREAEEARRQEAIAEASYAFLKDDFLSEAALNKKDIKLSTAIDWAAYRIEHRFRDQPLARARIHRLISHAYIGHSKYDKALEHAEESARITKEELKPEHPEYLEAIETLALVYMLSDRHPEAEHLYKQTLKVRENSLGTGHPYIADSLNNLADFYMMQKFFSEGFDFGVLGKSDPDATAIQGTNDLIDPLLTRALEIRKDALGPEHPDVANSLQRLASLHRARKDYPKAEQYLESAQEILEKTYGTEHPVVADNLNELARLYMSQERYDKAELFFKRTLAIRETSLDIKHSDRAQTHAYLYRLYDQLKQYDKAELHAKYLLEIREEELGRRHKDVDNQRTTLAKYYRLQGKLQELEQLYKDRQDVLDTTYGSDSSESTYNRYRLAELYHTQNRYDEAAQIYNDALVIQDKALNIPQSHIATIQEKLAALYDAQGRYDEAEPFHERVLKIKIEMYGADNEPRLIKSLYNLAENHRKQTKFTDAEPLFIRILAHVRAQPYNKGGPWPYIYDGTDAMRGLALVYISQKRYDDADLLLAEAQVLLNRHVRNPEKSVFLTQKMNMNLNTYGHLHLIQGKYIQAEPYLKRALSIWDQAPVQNHPGMAETLELMAELYRATDRQSEATVLEQRAAQINRRLESTPH